MVCGGYRPGLEKRKSKSEGYAWTVWHNGQNKNGGNITGEESMCDYICLLCLYMFVLIVVDIYVPFCLRKYTVLYPTSLSHLRVRYHVILGAWFL